MAFGLVTLFAYLGCQPADDPDRSGDAQFASMPANSANYGFVWPPRIGESFPDIPLLDEKGHTISLSRYRGYVLMIAPIAMSSPGSQALAGGDRLGGLYGVAPQGNIESIDQMIADFSALSPDDERLLVVELLIYGPDRAQAEYSHIADWTQHFHRSTEQPPKEEGGVGAAQVPTQLLPRARRLTVVPAIDMRGPESFALIPGIQLLDKDGILRFDATGATPRHKLQQDVMPAIADYAARLSSVEGRYHIEWSTPR